MLFQVQHKNSTVILQIWKSWKTDCKYLNQKFDGYEQNGSVKNIISSKITDTDWMLLCLYWHI